MQADHFAIIANDKDVFLKPSESHLCTTRLNAELANAGVEHFAGPIDKLKSQLFPLLRDFKGGTRWAIVENINNLKKNYRIKVRIARTRELLVAHYLREAFDCYVHKTNTCSRGGRHLYLEAKQVKSKAAIPALVDELSLYINGPKGYIDATFIAMALKSIGESAAPSLIELLKAIKSGWSAAQLRGGSRVKPSMRWYGLQKYVRMLGIIGFKSFVPALVSMYKDNKEAHPVRTMALYALGRTGDKSVIPLLIRVLENDEGYAYRNQHGYRRSAAQALKRAGDASALPTLIEAITSRKKEYDSLGILGHVVSALRATVARVGKLDNKSVVPALLSILKTNNKPDVRGPVIIALGVIGDKSAVPILIAGLRKRQNNTGFTYYGELYSYFVSYHQAYALALGEMGDKSAVDDLVFDLNKTNDKGIERTILEALVKIGDKSVVHTLTDIRKNKGPDSRKLIDEALKKLK